MVVLALSCMLKMVARVMGTNMESLFGWRVLGSVLVEVVFRLRDGFVHCGASQLALLKNW